MNNPISQLPPKARAGFYAVFATIGVALGAIQVGFAAADAGQPTWLTVALAVYGFLGGAFGFTATTHVPAAPDAHARHREINPYWGTHNDPADGK